MSTNAMIGHGSVFAILSGGAYVSIGEVTSITPPSIARDAVDATHMQSPEGWREFIAGLKDGGEVGIEINLVPGSASLALLIAQFDTATLATHKITFPDGTTWVFSGLLTAFEPEDPLDDKIAASCTFKVSGKPTLTQA